jgi:uncharacterized protein with beta-barrel porin domain
MSGWKLLRVAVWPLGMSLVPLPAASAADLTVGSGQTLTTTQDIGSDSTAIVEEGGSITISVPNYDAGALIGTDRNTIINYGTISALDSGEGVHLENDNSIVNYGTIQTSAQASTLSSEDAITIHGDDNSIVNLGIIQVFDSINGYGVHIAEGTGNSIVNYGIIDTTGQGTNAIHIESTANTVVNHGTITTAGTTADALYIVGGNTFINSGTLISTEDDAIHMNGTGSEIYLLAGSAVYGEIDLHDSNDHTFDIGNGLNAMLTFENYLPAHINTNGMPSVTDATNLQLAVVDPTGFAMAEDLLVDITDQAFDAVRSRLGPSQVSAAADAAPLLAIMPAADVYPTSIGERGIAPWVSLIGTWRQQSASGITWSGEQQLQGVTAGIDLNWTPSLRGGAFAGAAKAELVVDDEAQEIDTDNIWGGGYVGSELGDYHMELAALAGWQSNESVRRMVDNTSWPSGVAYADASYDGFFVSPQASISRDWELAGQTLNSILTLRYSGLFLKAYEEEGSNANLTVDSRDVHLLTARGEIAHAIGLPFSLDGLQLVAIGGGDARYAFGDEVSAVLLDQSINFDPDDQSTTLSGFGGARLSFTTPSEFLTLGLAGKAVASTDEALALAFQVSALLHL